MNVIEWANDHPLAAVIHAVGLTLAIGVTAITPIVATAHKNARDADSHYYGYSQKVTVSGKSYYTNKINLYPGGTVQFRDENGAKHTTNEKFSAVDNPGWRKRGVPD